ncbi:hypothetical protein [Sinorhizobium medicae]|uniref:hypothetical protein n=1 Tax=Sinorhizobium medicae TaxID=110321 RepID=UPI000FE010CC|nr:hypothetical protein [Sinorhizobium medicae]RVJ72531.1 hypothetical protein CN168_26680 [Sinorhizobium medicae]
MLSELDAASGQAEFQKDAVPEQLSFLVGEGGQIPYSEATKLLNRALRFVIVRTNMPRDRVVMMSIDDRPEATDGLLQVLSWDPVKAAYNFYQRRSGVWFYSGDSYDALDPPSRGMGPFDGHVNGSLAMKELRRPWLHWKSQSVSIPPEAFQPAHPVLSHRIFQEAAGAELLETQFIQPGIDRWTQARLTRSLAEGHVDGFDKLLRQTIQTTTVNIVASDREFSEVGEGVRVNLPYEILLNAEFWLRAGMLDPQTIQGRVSVDGGHLMAAISEHGVALADPDADFRRPGEAFFAFACPAPAYEDLSVTFAIIDAGIISKRLARALLAIDFCNPIQSAPRERLVRHIPTDGSLGTGPGSCEARLIASIAATATAEPNSEEAAVMNALETGDEAEHRARLSREIRAYIEAVKQRLSTPEGVSDIVRLIDSRRRYFRTLGISEFALTLPVSGIPADAPFLRMTPEGRVAAASQLSA